MLYRLHPSSVLTTILLVGTIGASLGCTEAQTDAVELTDRFVQGSNRPVDLLFVLDNSTTMAEVQEDFSLAFPTLLSLVDAAEVSWQMGLVSTDMDDPNHRGRLQSLPNGQRILSASTLEPATQMAEAALLGTEGSQREQGIAAAWAAVTPPLSSHDNLGFSRDGARLHIVIISDEEDCSNEGRLPGTDPSACASQAPSLIPVHDYYQRFFNLKEDPLDVTVHAFVETGNSGRYIGCNGTNIGTRYMDLAWSTGGKVYTYCEDLNQSFADIADQVLGKRHALPLTRSADPESIEVRLIPEGEPDTSEGGVLHNDPSGEDGWNYNSEYNVIRFWGPSIPPAGSTVKVHYRIGLGE